MSYHQNGGNGGNRRVGYSGGASHLARIHGTEEDRVNCPFYFKIGACRHGDRCSRQHHMPAFSQTILIKHIYQHPARLAELKAAEERSRGNPNASAAAAIDKRKAWEDFLQFYENMYMELSKFGRIDSLNVCDNLGDHMVGHVYCKFFDEEEAADALQIMNGRYYDGRKMVVEYSPVTDFREARCRDYDDDQCSRGGFCNFMHVRPVPDCLTRSLEEDAENERRREAMERRGRGVHRRRGRSHSQSSSSSSSDDDSRNGGAHRSRSKRPRRDRSSSRGRRSRSRS